MLAAVIPERLVRIRVRTVLAILGIVISTFVVLDLLWIARGVLTWIIIAAFLALALNPAVEALVRRGLGRRTAVAIVFVGTIALIIGIAALFVPTLVNEINGFRKAVPGYVDDVTHGRGVIGRLADKYDLVQRVKKAVQGGGFDKVLGASGLAVSVARGIISTIVATVTIAFLTLFMLLEGPAWIERFYSVVPDEHLPRVRRVGHAIYRTIGGYVSGNLLISLIAGVSTTVVLYALGVPFAVALGLLVAILDLVPLAGATLAAILVSAVAFVTVSVPAAIAIVVFFIVYQQIENHLLQPLVYSRTVQLSPLAILIAVLVGAELAGILGALAAIPVAGTIQILILEWLQIRRERQVHAEPAPEPL
jgi:predicted PurR-regulated permease PerM